MININSVIFPLGKGTATKLQVQVNPFLTSATTAQLYYSLHTEEGTQIDQGNLSLTEEEYANWGADNAHIENIVLSQLNLTRNENN